MSPGHLTCRRCTREVQSPAAPRASATASPARPSRAVMLCTLRITRSVSRPPRIGSAPRLRVGLKIVEALDEVRNAR
jgi:hypothetical protein